MIVCGRPGVFRSLVLLVGAGVCLTANTGCSMFPESMQPHQLWKLNRGPAYTQDPFMNVPDAARESGGEKVESR